ALPGPQQTRFVAGAATISRRLHRHDRTAPSRRHRVPDRTGHGVSVARHPRPATVKPDWKPSGVRRFAHLGAVVATTAVLIPALAAFSPVQTPSAAPAEADPDEAPLVIDAITPQAVKPDSTLRITGEITNTTDSALDDLTIRFRYS